MSSASPTQLPPSPTSKLHLPPQTYPLYVHGRDLHPLRVNACYLQSSLHTVPLRLDPSIGWSGLDKGQR
eukprot:1872042-Amphidinium_carterae.1